MLSNDVINALNELKEGMGSALAGNLNARLSEINSQLSAQAGKDGTVSIAKQGQLPALDANGSRITGIGTPRENTDLINLNYMRRFLSCDAFAQMWDDCLHLPTAAAALVGGSPAQLFPPDGFMLFVDTPQAFAYYIRTANVGAGAATNDERAGAIGAIDLSDKHDPTRIGYLVLSRVFGPTWFAVDETRLIGFVLRVVRSSPGSSDDFILGAIDLSNPADLQIISLAGAVPDESLSFTQLVLANKRANESTTFGYYTAWTTQNGHNASGFFQNVIFILHVWNLTVPNSMQNFAQYTLGGYRVGGNEPIVTDFSVNGYNFAFATDSHGTGQRAVNLSAGDSEFNFTPRSDIFLNHWDISVPGDVRRLGRVRLGAGLPLSGFYLVSQVRGLAISGTAAFALVTIYDPVLDPVNPVRNHLFGIDCSESVPVIKTDMVSPCADFTALTVYGTCLVTRDGLTDVLYDVSDLSNFRLVGGCTTLSGGFENYRPGHLYYINQFAQPDPDPTKPAHGFTIQYFGESGIDCP